MLAGHCVMFHEVMVAGVLDTLRGEEPRMRRSTRSNLVAMNRAFLDTLTRLERYQERPAEGRRDDAETRSGAPAGLATEADGMPLAAAGAPVGVAVDAPVDAPGDAAVDGAVESAGDAAVGAPLGDAADAAAPGAGMAPNRPGERVRSPGSATVSAPGAVGGPMAATEHAKPETSLPGTPTRSTYRPSPEVIAACRANPDAVAALDAGDAAAFARAMGIRVPCEGFLAAAAAPGSAFDRDGFIPPVDARD